MTFDTTLHRDLTDLADESAPACSVVVAQGISDGRRSVRNRQAAGLGAGAVAIVAAAAVGVPALLSGGHASPVSQGPAAGATVPHFSGGSDPLTTAAAFGWLPAGLNVVQADSQPGQPDRITATGSGAPVDFELSVYAAGQQVIPQHFKGGDLAPHTTAPSVNGHAAYWTFVPGSSESAADGIADLAWNYAPNAWAVLEYADPVIGSGSTGTIYQVADAVTFGGSVAQPMPFHLAQPANLTAVDAGLSYHSAGTQAGSQPGAAQLISAGVVLEGPQAQTPAHPADRSQLTIEAAAPGDLNATAIGTVTILTVDGHRARLGTVANTEQLTVYGVNGMDVEIVATGAELATINASGGLVAYFHTVTWLGLNSVNWTTSVVGGQ